VRLTRIRFKGKSGELCEQTVNGEDSLWKLMENVGDTAEVNNLEENDKLMFAKAH